MSASNPRFDKWVYNVSPDDRTSDVAARTLRVRLNAVRYYLDLAADCPDDIEHVHELRVWSRRAAAALRLYHDLLPSHCARWIGKQMRRLRRAASTARDFDVLTQRLR